MLNEFLSESFLAELGELTSQAQLPEVLKIHTGLH